MSIESEESPRALRELWAIKAENAAEAKGLPSREALLAVQRRAHIASVLILEEMRAMHLPPLVVAQRPAVSTQALAREAPASYALPEVSDQK